MSLLSAQVLPVANIAEVVTFTGTDRVRHLFAGWDLGQDGHPGRRPGRGEQRRVRLHADRRFVAEPYRGPVHALCYSALDGTDHAGHKEQGSLFRRYIIWRSEHAADERLREVVAGAIVA
ncbi:hypothetical protein [Streptomyces sp. NPDC004680]|uniref:hypothetical protein n=1 Tax=Streptomyces sp. NPDC004680 TaxID=3154287 RepID=UPI0033B9025B